MKLRSCIFPRALSGRSLKTHMYMFSMSCCTKKTSRRRSDFSKPEMLPEESRVTFPFGFSTSAGF
uniref:Uncharacterized protein n=1 Tax=Oryza punctata TaxID=4537 RepID=A0A0E0JE38_ORYPU